MKLLNLGGGGGGVGGFFGGSDENLQVMQAMARILEVWCLIVKHLAP
jgi:hypothetical protein